MQQARPSRTWAERVALALSVVFSVTSVVTVTLMWPGNVAWMGMGAGPALIYGLISVAMWRKSAWASRLALGVGVWGLAVWGQSTLVVQLPFNVAIAGGSLLWVLALARSPSSLPRAHQWALSLTGAAGICAVYTAAIPDQTFIARVLQLFGAAILVAGTLGVVRGKVWGVLLAGASRV